MLLLCVFVVVVWRCCCLYVVLLLFMVMCLLFVCVGGLARVCACDWCWLCVVSLYGWIVRCVC